MKKKWFVLTLLFATLFVAGCTNKENSTKDQSSKKTSAATTQTLTDAMKHKVTVPLKPKKVIASYLEDYLVSLDITPVAQWSVKDASSTQNYLQKELKDVPTIDYSLPFEAVTSFDPDLLIIGSSATVEGGKYAQYKKIAPTYVIDETASWRDKMLEIGKVVNKEKAAKKVLADYDKKTAAAEKEIKKKAAGKSAAVIWITNNSAFMVSDTAASGALLYNELGLEVPNLTKEISKTATADWSAVSLEKLAGLDADYLFVVNSDTSPAMLQDDIWKNIPAVKNGNVFEFGPETSWLYSGPIAYNQIIDDVLDSLDK